MISKNLTNSRWKYTLRPSKEWKLTTTLLLLQALLSRRWPRAFRICMTVTFQSKISKVIKWIWELSTPSQWLAKISWKSIATMQFRCPRRTTPTKRGSKQTKDWLSRPMAEAVPVKQRQNRTKRSIGIVSMPPPRVNLATKNPWVEVSQRRTCPTLKNIQISVVWAYRTWILIDADSKEQKLTIIIWSAHMGPR